MGKEHECLAAAAAEMAEPYDLSPYRFNAAGELRHRETGAPFPHGDRAAYEALMAQIEVYLQNRLVNEHRLRPVRDPASAPPERAVSFFVTRQFLTSPRPLLVLICGTGAVRSGMWARSQITDTSLAAGTVLPELELARSQRWEVAILNPNFVPRGLAPDPKPLPGLDGMDPSCAHAVRVWHHWIAQSPASQILVIAHSYGGANVTRILESHATVGNTNKVFDRLKAVALTDAVTFPSKVPFASKFLSDGSRCINWVCNNAPLGTPLPARATTARSAGTTSHVCSTASSRPDMWPFLKSALLQ